jgi:hypothetical protein
MLDIFSLFHSKFQMDAQEQQQLKRSTIHQLLNQQEQDIPEEPKVFIQRVSTIPLLSSLGHSIGNAYEATKNASRVVKYSAESVESGVKSISVPVLHSLEPALAPLDRFACSQLDLVFLSLLLNTFISWKDHFLLI